MNGIDMFQTILIVLVSILVANYLYIRFSLRAQRMTELDEIEGFANPDGPDGDVVILGNEHLYDEFYAKVYDKLTGGPGHRIPAEVAMTLAWAKSYRPEVETLQVLDVGCATGHAVAEFRKAGCGKVVGLDNSTAMIAAARRQFPKADFRVGDVEQTGQFAAGEFNLATLYYFTYYELHDVDTMFKNVFQWLQPGGCLVIHLVNREKFDPILEPASPFAGFSLQKYNKERIRRSRVSFDKFDYEAEFVLEGERAEFHEDFRFKGAVSKKRRQIHTMRMPKMEAVVGRAEANGFSYKQYIDMTAIGYEYQYLFCFVR